MNGWTQEKMKELREKAAKTCPLCRAEATYFEWRNDKLKVIFDCGSWTIVSKDEEQFCICCERKEKLKELPTCCPMCGSSIEKLLLGKRVIIKFKCSSEVHSDGEVTTNIMLCKREH